LRSLHRSILTGQQHASILPTVYQSLAAKQIHLRRGEVSMIAGQPGAGKSTLALLWALRSQRPTLYFCADTSASTMALRMASAISDIDQSAVEARMSDRSWAAETLRAGEHIRWCFESAPSLKDIELEVDAFSELHGDFPELIVVDNLMDCTHNDGDSWESMRSLLRELKWWARHTEAAVLVLHHTSEATDGRPCPPRSSIQGKVAQTPALILTVTNAQPGFMGVCAVKNRYGKADVNGGDVTWLVYEPARMHLSDMEAR
jgi:predicted ATP-dependent serine protease